LKKKKKNIMGGSEAEAGDVNVTDVLMKYFLPPSETDLNW
jgi:hypothetical protein